MKKAFFLFLLLIPVLVFGLDTKPWTIMVYLDADNNLEDAGLDDYLEMSKIGSDTNVNIIVMLDRINGYSTAYGDWTGTKYFYVVKDSTPVAGNAVQDLGEKNMGNPQTAKDFILWSMTNYPAEHYCLVFWDHGDGWLRRSSTTSADDPKDSVTEYDKGACSDETSSDYLYFTGGEFEDIFSYFYALNGNQKIDIVGFDVCSDGMWENMVASEPYFEYFVASEMSEWGEGWSYWYFLEKLQQSSGALTAKQLADYIVEAYANGDNGNNTSNPSSTGDTQSSIDLSQLPNLNSKIDLLAQELACAKASGYTTQISAARNDTFECDYDSQIDLYHFCSNLKTKDVPSSLKDAATEVQTAITSAVSSNFRKATYPNNNGIAIYYPSSGYNSNYNNTHSNVTSTYWDNYLKGEGCPQPVLISYSGKTVNDSSGNNDGIINSGESIGVIISLLNTGTSTATNVSATLTTSDTYISMINTTSTYSDISSGGKQDSNSEYTFSVDSGCPDPHKIEFIMTVTADSYSDSFTVNMAVGEIPILLVIDDNGGGNETDYRAALDANGFLYDEWVVSGTSNGPGLSVMQEYDLLIWFTGFDYTDTLQTNDENNLITYLNGGGSLLLISQDYLYDKFGSSGITGGFALNYLHVDGFGSDIGNKKHYGISCDPVSNEMQIEMDFGANQDYTDTLTIGTGGKRMFKTLGNVPTALRYPENYDDDKYHVIFLPWRFEFISNGTDPNNQNTLMKTMVDWLLGEYSFENHDPSLVTLQYPADLATDVSQPISMNWTNSTDPDAPCDAVTYSLYYSTQTGCAQPLKIEDISSSGYTLSGLLPETTYYWKVRAVDQHGGYSETGVWSFVTAPNQAPAAFNLTSPAEGTELTIYPILFKWNQAVDPEGDAIVYKLWYSTDPTFATKTTVNNIGSTSYSLNSGLIDAEYYWKVFASDGINPDVESSNTLSFIFEESFWGETLDEVRIYPNPANPLESPIIFDKLPENGRLLIYTLSGELILEVKIESPVYSWAALNQAGKQISSGIYLAVIKDENNNVEIRKVAIIKR